mgnify:CR=1 FL=1
MSNRDRHSSLDTADTSARTFAHETRDADPEKLRIYEEEVDRLVKTLARVPGHEYLMNDAFYEIYLRCHFGNKISLKEKVRRLRGAVVRNLSERASPTPTVDEIQVDDILENSLQMRDFRAIRFILNHEGYGVPLYEPNDLVIPAELYNERSHESEKLEIEVTPEEYEILMAPPETCPPPEPSTEELAIQQAFAGAMTESIPLRLERLIRRRDVETLRIMLRLYGHRLLPDDPPYPGHVRENVPAPTHDISDKTPKAPLH